jgi:hypothetical protein
MVSSGLLRRVARVRTDVSEEPGASFTLNSHRRENLKSYKFFLEEWRLLGCYAMWLL